ncbi:hypothetical protein OHA37_39305 [Streptomyces sp. NBC_00335]|uniref:hypothetical protein n=1 Tax=unclassified Streptomyces TaxID=2593676 RepID=UPI0022560790|nr:MULTISPECIES: hypothetical protein [unclassified Streptomyces]MCX5409878.1 hypothetical protein [Streptomyces sp. NBC_00086]
MLDVEPANLGAHWAARSHLHPAQVWREWDDVLGVALLPAGRLWDAVALPYRQLQAVAQDLAPYGLLEDSAILADLAVDRCYLFTPVGTAARWDVPGTTALGEGWWLVASKPGGRQRRTGTWVQEPGWQTALTDPVLLRESLRRNAEAAS